MKFLSDEDNHHIVQEIVKAEAKTSGEIRVHIDKSCKGDPLKRARSLFFTLEMEKTMHRNAVLIYLSVEDHKMAIYGDQGIHDVVPDDFWQSEIELMTSHFKKQAYGIGIIAAVKEVGEKLKTHFPFDKKTDSDELDNEISYTI